MKYFYKQKNKIYIKKEYNVLRKKYSCYDNLDVDVTKIDDINLFIKELHKLDANLELNITVTDNIKIFLWSDLIIIYLFNVSSEILSKLVLEFTFAEQLKKTAEMFNNISDRAKLQLKEYKYFKKSATKENVFEFKTGNKYFTKYKNKDETDFLDEIIDIGKRTGNTNFKVLYGYDNSICLLFNSIKVSDIPADAINYLLNAGFVWVNENEINKMMEFYRRVKERMELN